MDFYKLENNNRTIRRNEHGNNHCMALFPMPTIGGTDAALNLLNEFNRVVNILLFHSSKPDFGRHGLGAYQIHNGCLCQWGINGKNWRLSDSDAAEKLCAELNRLAALYLEPISEAKPYMRGPENSVVYVSGKDGSLTRLFWTVEIRDAEAAVNELNRLYALTKK